MTSPLRVRLRSAHADQDGLSAGAEALVFGVLVFVMGTIIVLNGWAVLDATFAVNAAAREAARTVVEAGAIDRASMVGLSGSTVTTGAAHEAAVAAMSGHGEDPSVSGFVVMMPDDPWSGGSGPPGRCATVSFEVQYPVRTISIPFGWGDAITVRGQYSEIIDPLRSGLEGVGTCD